MKNMKIMRLYLPTAKNICFVTGIGLTKQILPSVFGRFCLILPHLLHDFSFWVIGIPENMKIMRFYEDR